MTDDPDKKQPQQPKAKPIWQAATWFISKRFTVTPIVIAITFILGYLLGGQ